MADNAKANGIETVIGIEKKKSKAGLDIKDIIF